MDTIHTLAFEITNCYRNTITVQNDDARLEKEADIPKIEQAVFHFYR
jgi:hypothetical protein